jgi:hypothetical protein
MKAARITARIPPTVIPRLLIRAASQPRQPPSLRLPRFRPPSPITAVGRPGVSESTRVAAGVAPSRSLAASIISPAVG